MGHQSTGTLILAPKDSFQTPELQNYSDNEFVLFKATKVVIICYRSNEKLIHKGKASKM